MQIEAAVKTAEGVAAEQTGLNRLDLVKHAIKTVLTTLNDCDELAIVSFSKEAKVVLPLSTMDRSGRTVARESVKMLQPESSTNLWAGLEMGHAVLEAARTSRGADKSEVVLLLTDGQPNECAHESGELAALDDYRRAHPGCDGQTVVSAFGFGYDLNSTLLLQIAKRCGGGYMFIPDAGFVGTAFVNAVANCLTMISPEVQVVVTPAKGVGTVVILGDHDVEPTDIGTVVRLGPLHIEQSRDIVFEIKDGITEGDSVAQVNVVTRDHSWSATVPAAACGRAVVAEVNRLRLLMCSALATDSDDGGAREVGQCNSVDKVILAMQKSPSSKHPAVRAMLEDLMGQVKEAFSADFWDTWGAHYVRSLCRSHALQQCANFKDPGLQLYGGALFKSIRDHADEAFVSLPPPEPAIDPELEKLRRQFGDMMAPRAAAVDMGRVYHNRSNPCFAPGGLVALANSQEKRVDALRRGDVLANGARVRCVIETCCADSVAELCKVHQLWLTPWHPIRLGGRWCFPSSVTTPRVVPCPAVFSIALDAPSPADHVIVIDGVECVTLGHGVMDDSVASHPFYGSKQVINCLMGMDGWAQGYIVLSPGCATRDPVFGITTGLIQETPGTTNCTREAQRKTRSRAMSS